MNKKVHCTYLALDIKNKYHVLLVCTARTGRSSMSTNLVKEITLLKTGKKRRKKKHFSACFFSGNSATFQPSGGKSKWNPKVGLSFSLHNHSGKLWYSLTFAWERSRILTPLLNNRKNSAGVKLPLCRNVIMRVKKKKEGALEEKVAAKSQL